MSEHTIIPVPKVLTWNADKANPVGAEYIIMEKAQGTPLYHLWGTMPEIEKLRLIKALTRLESQLLSVKLPAYGNLYLKSSMRQEVPVVPLEKESDPFSSYCIGPSSERSYNFGPSDEILQVEPGPCRLSETHLDPSDADV